MDTDMAHINIKRMGRTRRTEWARTADSKSRRLLATDTATMAPRAGRAVKPGEGEDASGRMPGPAPVLELELPPLRLLRLVRELSTETMDMAIMRLREDITEESAAALVVEAVDNNMGMPREVTGRLAVNSNNSCCSSSSSSTCSRVGRRVR
jgi:hypothetical protein